MSFNAKAMKTHARLLLRLPRLVVPIGLWVREHRIGWLSASSEIAKGFLRIIPPTITVPQLLYRQSFWDDTMINATDNTVIQVRTEPIREFTVHFGLLRYEMFLCSIEVSSLSVKFSLSLDSSKR